MWAFESDTFLASTCFGDVPAKPELPSSNSFEFCSVPCSSPQTGARNNLRPKIKKREITSRRSKQHTWTGCCGILKSIIRWCCWISGTLHNRHIHTPSTTRGRLDTRKDTPNWLRLPEFTTMRWGSECERSYNRTRSAHDMRHMMKRG